MDSNFETVGDILKRETGLAEICGIFCGEAKTKLITIDKKTGTVKRIQMVTGIIDKPYFNGDGEALPWEEKEILSDQTKFI